MAVSINVSSTPEAAGWLQDRRYPQSIWINLPTRHVLFKQDDNPFEQFTRFLNLIWHAKPTLDAAAQVLLKDKAIETSDFVTHIFDETQLVVTNFTRSANQQDVPFLLMQACVWTELLAAATGLNVHDHYHVFGYVHGERPKVHDPEYHLCDTMSGLRINDLEEWFGDLEMFRLNGVEAIGYKEGFFKRVAVPLTMTFDAFAKDERLLAAKRVANIADYGWRRACELHMEHQWTLTKSSECEKADTSPDATASPTTDTTT